MERRAWRCERLCGRVDAVGFGYRVGGFGCAAMRTEQGGGSGGATILAGPEESCRLLDYYSMPKERLLFIDNLILFLGEEILLQQR